MSEPIAKKLFLRFEMQPENTFGRTMLGGDMLLQHKDGQWECMCPADEIRGTYRGRGGDQTAAVLDWLADRLGQKR